MFELEDAYYAVDVIADTSVPLIDRLKAAVELKWLAEAAEAVVAAELAKEHSWQDTDEFDVEEDTLRPLRIGADGTDPVDESLPLEIAVAQASSVTAATWYLRDVVNLEARHPATWDAILRGRIPLWRGRQIAQTCANLELSHDDTVKVDERLANVLGEVGWPRVNKALKAAILRVAPQAFEQQARLRRDRYVDKYDDSDDPASAWFSARLDSGDATFLDATISRLADALAKEGDESDHDHRRAKALGMLATPELAMQKMTNIVLPTAQVFVHIHQDILDAEDGLIRVERQGPALVQHLSHILGHSRIKLTPVLHTLGDEVAVDAYEIPDRIREAVIQRDRFEMFPWSSREARHLDMDHTVPYRNGRSAQTRPSNLGPLTRQAHRAKTHAGWQLTQPTPGEFHWTTQLGQTLIVDQQGTHTYHQRS